MNLVQKTNEFIDKDGDNVFDLDMDLDFGNEMVDDDSGFDLTLGTEENGNNQLDIPNNGLMLDDLVSMPNKAKESENSERLRSIISNNIVYANYRNSEKIGIDKRKLTKDKREIINSILEFLESNRNNILSTSDIASYKKQINTSINKFEYYLLDIFDMKNFFSNKVDLEIDTDMKEILTKIGFPFVLFQVFSGLRDKMENWLSSVITSMTDARNKTVSAQNLSDSKLTDLLKGEVNLFDVESMEFNISTLGQEVVCPVCGTKNKHNLLKFKNVYGDYVLSNKSEVMFNHTPMICPECMSVVALSEEGVTYLNSILDSKKNEALLSQDIESSQLIKILPNEEELRNLGICKVVGNISLDSEGYSLNSNLEENMKKRYKSFEMESNLKDKRNIEMLFERYKSPQMNTTAEYLMEYNAKYLLNNKGTFIEQVASVVLTSEVMRMAHRRKQNIIGLKKSLLLLDRINSSIKAVYGGSKGDIPESSISKTIETRLEFINNWVSYLNITKFKPITEKNMKKNLQTVEKLVTEEMEKISKEIKVQEEAKKSCIDYFIDNHFDLVYKADMSLIYNSVDSLRYILENDSTFYQIITLARKDYTKRIWVEYLINMEKSKVDRLGGTVLNKNMGDKTQIQNSLKRMKVNGEDTEDYFADLISDCNVKYVSILGLLKNSIKNNELYKLEYYLIYLLKNKEEYTVDSKIEGLLKEWYKKVEKEHKDIYNYCLGEDTTEYTKMCLLTDEGFALEDVLEEHNKGTIKKWTSLGFRKSSRVTLKGYLKEKVKIKNIRYKTPTDKNYNKILNTILSNQEIETELDPYAYRMLFNFSMQNCEPKSLMKYMKKFPIQIEKDNEFKIDTGLSREIKDGNELLKSLVELGSVTDLGGISCANKETDSSQEYQLYLFEEYREYSTLDFRELKLVLALNNLACMCSEKDYERCSYLVPERFKEDIDTICKLHSYITYENELNKTTVKLSLKDFDWIRSYLEVILEATENEMSSRNRTECEYVISTLNRG